MLTEHLGICTWSLGNDVASVSKAMRATGLKHLHLDVTAVDEFAAVIKEENWEISSTMIAFPQEDYSSLQRIRETGGIIPDHCWEDNRELVMEAINRTARLGVPFLSTHAGFIDHEDKTGYAVFCRRMLELADAAGKQNIMLLMETGQETAKDLKRFLLDLNHPAIGVNFDPANMILYNKGNPIDAVDILAPWIRHVHIKDAVMTKLPGEWGTEVPWGDGEVPHELFVNSLERTGYQGMLAIEREAGNRRIEDIVTAAQRIGKML